MNKRLSIALLLTLILSSSVSATEPNESFDSATTLSPGVLTVSDALITSNTAPDTLLGVRDQFGSIYFVDDDGSPVGDGMASGVGGVSTNSGSIDFAITGYGDDDFTGSHSESGNYEVFVDVYDFFDDPVDSFSEVRRLDPGVVDEFSFSNSNWIGGSYDVYINNLVGYSDVDFFTFTGLAPGQQFAARTSDPESSGIDTLLGWFNNAGELVESDDDSGGGTLSQINGTIPAGGKLTFAVTGYGDDGFLGSHNELGEYELQLELVGSLQGDYNGNNKVDAADYTVWRNNLGSGTSLPNDNTAGVGQDDYVRWKTNFGQSAGSGSGANSLATVPEPTTCVLLMAVVVGWGFFHRRRSSASSS